MQKALRYLRSEEHDQVDFFVYISRENCLLKEVTSYILK